MQHMLPTHWCNAIIDEDTGTPLEYWQLLKQTKDRDVWVTSFANELGQLVGIQDGEGTNTI